MIISAGAYILMYMISIQQLIVPHGSSTCFIIKGPYILPLGEYMFCKKPQIKSNYFLNTIN